MQTTKKHSIRLGRLVGKGLVLGALVVTVAGCVVDPSPRGYYRNYPNDYSYRDYSQPYDYPGNTVGLDRDEDDRRGSSRREHGDYDDHWDYGRRGNGNFHGTDADDRHDD